MVSLSSLTSQKLEWRALGEILRSNRLKVPVYQRAYSWTRVELADFWDDLHRVIRGRGEYFMGPVVAAAPASDDPERRLTIIDGQQRLATASILFAVLRDRLNQLGDTDTANQIQRDFLGSTDIRTREVTPNLVLNDEDRRFFQTIVSGAESPFPSTLESHKRILEAKNFFKAKAEQYGPQQARERDWIVDWVVYLSERAIVMFAQVPEESDAYMIFETLNARGVELAVADLLKNHLFSTAKDSLEEVRYFWRLATSAINQVDPQAITDFLRHHWNSKYQLAREKELYRVFKPEIRTRALAETFAGDLEAAARDYAALLSPGHERWRELGEDAANAFETLFSFRLEQNRPLLLAAMQTLPSSELARLLISLVAWSVRGLVVGGIGKGQTETTYANAALAIRRREAVTVEDIFAHLDSIIPSDHEFRVAFEAYSPPTNVRAHYLLRALELGVENQREPWLVPNPDREELTLEHVLPRRPTLTDWPAFSSTDQVGEYVSMLGNLVLIPRARNVSLGNRPFLAKKPTYSDAPLKVTKMVCHYQTWGPKEIEARQAELADLALRVWPRQPATRR